MGPDTRDPDDTEDWTPDNPARSQCGVTALVLQDLLGGDLILGEVFVGETQSGYHYWNRLPGGVEVDLTADQFRPGEVVTGGRLQHRPPDAPRRCREQYELLRERVFAAVALVGHVRSSDWLMGILRDVRDEQIPDAWVGAGALRDLVWGERYGTGFSPPRVRDVDVAFFDPDDLSRDNDDRVTARLVLRSPETPWEARNQAAVHTWYADRFGGGPVEPFSSIHDALGTWPETATAVAVRLDAFDTLEICAPLGLTDLLEGVWRRNPRRVSLARSLERLERHSPGTRWPGVTVIRPEE